MWCKEVIWNEERKEKTQGTHEGTGGAVQKATTITETAMSRIPIQMTTFTSSEPE